MGNRAPQRSSRNYHLTLLGRRETEAQCLSRRAQGHLEFMAEQTSGFPADIRFLNSQCFAWYGFSSGGILSRVAGNVLRGQLYGRCPTWWDLKAPRSGFSGQACPIFTPAPPLPRACLAGHVVWCPFALITTGLWPIVSNLCPTAGGHRAEGLGGRAEVGHCV